jgi:hypothetical protein
MEEQQRLHERADQVEKDGIAKYGKESWSAMVGAIGRLGATPDQVAMALRSSDPLAVFGRAGREGLLADLVSEDRGIARQAERVYSKIREDERAAHRSNSASAYRTLVPNLDRK